MKVILLLTLLVLSISVYSQVWQETATTPEGAGVTDMVVRQSNQHIFVATSSFNFPNGDMGGIRRSTDDGNTWANLNDVYISRTIIDAPDGNLYASIWPFPQPEGLYLSTDNGDNWGAPLVTVPTGDNIFSIAINPSTNPNTIFVGTRNGPLRSIDNGFNWSPAINGIPPNSWVRDIEVDTSGIVVAATTKGLFTSTNNGDIWQQATGIAAGDTIVKLIFDYPPETDELAAQTRLLAGSDDGNLYQSFAESKYLSTVLLVVFGSTYDIEISGYFIGFLKSLNKEKWGISTFPRDVNGGGFRTSDDNGVTWEENNQGLPPDPKTSALSGYSDKAGTSGDVSFYLGTFNNTNVGAKIYKINYKVSDVEQISTFTPKVYSLKQNYPNPFNPNTKIEYSIPEASFVQLKIYDILGNEVAELVNNELSAGVYRSDFTGIELSNGIYFYRIQAGSFVETKKMILLK